MEACYVNPCALKTIAAQVEWIDDYNALRATNTKVKQLIDSDAVLKRTFFFDCGQKSWVGRYSQRVFTPADGRVRIMITHPLLKYPNDTCVIFKIGGLILVDMLYWICEYLALEHLHHRKKAIKGAELFDLTGCNVIDILSEFGVEWDWTTVRRDVCNELSTIKQILLSRR